MSTRNGRVHGVGSSNPARSTGGRIGGGDHAGHGHFPICGSLKGDNTITMTLRHTIHKSSAQAAAKRADVSHVFAARQGFINVSNICGPCFTTRCLLLLCCDGLYRRAQSRAIDMSSHLKRPLHCMTGRPIDLRSGDLLYDVELRDSCYPGTYTDTRYRHPRGGGWS